jgi:hypothetical protein
MSEIRIFLLTNKHTEYEDSQQMAESLMVKSLTWLIMLDECKSKRELRHMEGESIALYEYILNLGTKWE